MAYGDVLVVDPLVVDRFRTVRSLESVGFDVNHTGTATEAMRCILRRNGIGLVFVEHQLPDFGPVALMHAAWQRCQSPPNFIMLFRLYEGLDYLHLRELGFAAIMTKPLNLELLERTLSNAHDGEGKNGEPSLAQQRRRLQRRLRREAAANARAQLPDVRMYGTRSASRD